MAGFIVCFIAETTRRTTKKKKQKTNKKQKKHTTFVLSSFKRPPTDPSRPYLEELVSSLVSLRIITIIPKNNTSFEKLSVSVCECEYKRIDEQQSQSNELNENCRYIHNLSL